MPNIALNCFLKLGLVGTALKMILSEGRFFCTRWKKRRFVCSPVLRREGGCWWRRRGLPTGSWSSCSSSPAASCSSDTCSSLTPPSRPNVSGWSSSRRSIDGARLRCRCPTMELSTRKQQPGRPSGAYIHDIREGPGLTLQGEVLHQLFCDLEGDRYKEPNISLFWDVFEQCSQIHKQTSVCWKGGMTLPGDVLHLEREITTQRMGKS